MIIGGGEVAARKAASLIAAGAEVTVISPELCPALVETAEKGSARHEARRYMAGDLEGAFIAVAATDDPEVNLAVSEEGRKKGVLVNCVRPPGAGDFIVPSSIHRGGLTIAVSTGGGCPALSKRLRKDIEALIGEGYDGFLSYLEEARNILKETVPDEADRRKCLSALVDSGLAQAFRDLPNDQARARAGDMLRELIKSMCVNNHKK